MTEEEKAQPTLITGVLDAQPNTSSKKSSKPQSAKKSSKSKKGKAKKKLTKKEIARRKREKAEQERLEQLRIERELEEKRIHQQEMEMERREQERLKQEDNELKALHQARIAQSHQIREERAKRDEWDRYISCEHSTDPNNQIDVNTFIAQWKETDNTDMKELFNKIEEATKLLDQLLNLRSTASVASEVAEFERLSNNIRDIRQIIENKIAILTQHHLLFSDRYVLAKNEVLLSANASGYSYGLWVNLAKNPRTKEIEFPFIKIEICKYIALASLAIRCTLSPFLTEFDKFLLLSPILACEFFQLPSPPKKIGTLMTLRQYSQSSGQLINLPYPLRNVNNPQPPLGFTMKINSENLPSDTDCVTVIKIDDIQNTESLVTDVELDKENAVVKFSCKKNGLFALALPKYAHFPFNFWEINSTNPESVEIFIRTAITELTLHIDEDGLVSMDSPIAFSKLTAPAALEKLQRHGINIIAPSSNNEFNDDVAAKLSGKTAELEDALSCGIADAATGFRIRRSKWNSQVSEDRGMFLVREIVEFGEPISDDERQNEEEDNAEPNFSNNATNTGENGEDQHIEEEEKKETKKKKPKLVNTKWKCILAKAKHINLVPYTENLKQPDLKMIKGSTFHQLLHPMFMDIASEKVRDRVKSGSSFIPETLRYLLQNLKLFSSTH